MLTTTFRKVKEQRACEESYKKFAKHKGGVKTYGSDTPFTLLEVAEVLGLDDALWCLRATIEPSDKIARLFACDCADHVLHFFEEKYPNDKRPRTAIEVARRYANGEATIEELSAASDGVWDAASDGVWAATRAARDAAGAAARAAAEAATWATSAAVWAVAGGGAAEREWQLQRFKELLDGIC